MRSISKFLLTLLITTLPLTAQEPAEELQKVLQNFMILLQQSQKSLQELAQTDQPAIPEEQNGYILYYKHITNGAKVEDRNDLLIKTQIEYKFLRDKEIPSSTVMAVVRKGKVELFGKVYSIEAAKKAMDLALHVRGVKEVTSYLIIKEPAKIKL